MRQSEDELREHLAEQLEFLRASAAAFDEGRRAEAKRLAVTLRILLRHNPASNSHALLAQLGVLDSLRFVDSAGELEEANMLTISNSLSLRIEVRPDGSSGASWVPVLGEFLTESIWPAEVQAAMIAAGHHIPRAGGALLPFDEWWSMPIIRDDQGARFSRSDLVLALAHKDGGGHVDPKVTGAYAALSRSNSLGWSSKDDQGERPMDDNPALPAVRQIAWEVEATLARGGYV